MGSIFGNNTQVTYTTKLINKMTRRNLTRINFDKLKGRENYDEWKVAARSYLIINELWREVTGDNPPSESPESNQIAISQITLMVEPSIYNYIIESDSAKEVWDGIKKAFDDSGVPRKVTILNYLVSIRLVQFKSMEKYINEILLFWHKSKVAGFKIDEDFTDAWRLTRRVSSVNPWQRE